MDACVSPMDGFTRLACLLSNAEQSWSLLTLIFVEWTHTGNNECIVAYQTLLSFNN